MIAGGEPDQLHNAEQPPSHPEREAWHLTLTQMFSVAIADQESQPTGKLA